MTTIQPTLDATHVTESLLIGFNELLHRAFPELTAVKVWVESDPHFDDPSYTVTFSVRQELSI